MEPKKTFELGVYTFGNTPRIADGGYGPTAQAIRDALEAVQVAEAVGLDFFGFGEHHTRSMPVSSPTSLVIAAAASTRRIKLGTTVSVLSTDEPIRVFQQLATAAALAPGRIDVVAGRGSSAITFPIFDLDERDYDTLFSSKLGLLLELNRHERVTWKGSHRRRPLDDTLIVPRPEQPLRIWLGTGGSPESVLRAVELGVPMFLGILGGAPEHWAQYGHAYREAWAQTGHPTNAADVAVAVHGFVGENDREAKATYLEHELRMFQTGSAEIGRPMRAPPAARPTLSGGWCSPADQTRSLSASSTCTNSSATRGRSCRWTSAACRTPPSSRASSCLAPGSSPRSARSSKGDDGCAITQRDQAERVFSVA
jgi:alkanesulfonate monooxygenase SsuD/methylene tetrahydromethanopterin reductase-like flavin-dependent oxidoreductase (luciferase family)